MFSIPSHIKAPLDLSQMATIPSTTKSPISLNSFSQESVMKPSGNFAPQPIQNQGFSQPTQNQSFSQSTQSVATPSQNQDCGMQVQTGQKVNLQQICPSLQTLSLKFSWNLPQNSNPPYEIDTQIFMLGANNKVLGDDWFVFYGNERSPDGSVQVGSDFAQVFLPQVAPEVDKIALVLSIYEGQDRGQHFGNVYNLGLQLRDQNTNQGLLSFQLPQSTDQVTCMTIGELYRKGGVWRFSAVGQGLSTDLAGLCGFYGVNLD